MPVAAGAWLTIIYSHPGIEQMKVRLTRVTTATAVGVGPELTASPAPNGRWRVTLPRDLRRANSIDVTATDASGNRRRFHSYVSR